MNVGIRKSFENDVRRIHDKKLLSSIERIISQIESADNLKLIANLKKLKATNTFIEFVLVIIALV